MQQSLEQDSQQTIGDVFASFLRSQKINDPRIFNLKNQGTVLMLFYGLIVVPQQIWGEQVLDKSFPFTTKKEFRILKPEGELPNSRIIRYLRNAVSHANFAVYSDLGQYVFGNEDKGKKNFEAVISHEGVGKFLTEVGTYYINNVAVTDF
jgi:hypothetical protein